MIMILHLREKDCRKNDEDTENTYEATTGRVQFDEAYFLVVNRRDKMASLK